MFDPKFIVTRPSIQQTNAQTAFRPSKKPRTILASLPERGARGLGHPARAISVASARSPRMTGSAASPAARAKGSATSPAAARAKGNTASPPAKASKPSAYPTPPKRRKASVQPSLAKGNAASAHSPPAAGDTASANHEAALRLLVSEGAAALARVQPEIAALPINQVRRLNVHVPSASLIGLGALPKLLTLRDEIEALRGHPPGTLDKLRDYALAAAHAYVLAMPTEEGETHLRTLLSEAAPLRERLLRSAELLVDFGLFDATRVAAIRRGTGHLDTALDLDALGTLFSESWPDVASKTPITLAEVERASTLGATLLEALGQRNQGTDGSADPREADEQLAKAYELYFRTYDECRRAVTYLRWHEGDADEFAPSLQQKGRRGRAAPNDSPSEGSGSEPGEEPSGEPDSEPNGGPVAGEPSEKGGANEDLTRKRPATRKRRPPGREALLPR